MQNNTLSQWLDKFSIFENKFSHIDYNSNFSLKGLTGSLQALVVAYFSKKSSKNILCILQDKEEAVYFASDLQTLILKEQILFFPFSYKRSFKEEKQDASSILLRTEVLDKLQKDTKPFFIVSYPEALSEPVISKKKLQESILDIKIEQTLSIEFVAELLDDQEFERVDFVYEPGQYAVRGSLIDVFSYSYKYPVRIDFFGDEIESIRFFDVENQLSKEKIDKISIIPNIQASSNTDKISFLEYLSAKNTILLSNDFSLVSKKIKRLTEDNKVYFEEKWSNPSDFSTLIKNFQQINLGKGEINPIYFHTEPQPAFNKNFDLIIADLQKKQEEQYQGIIVSENEKQIERLKNIFEDKNVNVDFALVQNNIHKGFVNHDERFFVYTDHQIFERYHKYKLQTSFSKEGAITLKELNSLESGDYVVHQDHGIGKFVGLQTIDVNGKPQESIRLVYRDNDVLFVSIHSLHRISKYKGKDGIPPKIHKLGSGVWQKTKSKAKKRVKDIAKDLISLYAKRLKKKGYAYSPDSYLQEELESSFLYEDTPDQYQASQAVKQDMEKAQPMDRLVCGDVGFGKTEIAIRAAFKAAVEGKQTAVLVPTTILAFQHYNTFSERMKDWPIKIAYMSRMRTAKQLTAIKKQLESGEIDIIIGTYKIIGKDVRFKDLGLLIIDEEQKFGVAIKEKLKQIKVNVDTLTLTATPIPRTLQLSLMGARDLSIINTPPPNRYPIQTELHTFNEEIIREAIYYEINRGGQVFFIHNRVQNMVEVEAMINRVCPDVSTIIAHGQMDGVVLEKTMLDFMEKKYDVLLATTIIESGLDIPNVNTIIVNNANNFGLSTLHQLRGRVGRSNKKAFAYFLTPDPITMTDEARRRLRAIEDFSDLGSGFQISLQDLDIRGAGDVLGGEQSGFIADIGFDTYHRILSEAVQELKENEFKSIFKEEKEINPEAIDNIQFLDDCQIDTDRPLRFPSTYIQNIGERMKLYRSLDNLKNEKELQEFVLQLEDRFGVLPEETRELIEVIRLRKIAIKNGIEQLRLKNNLLKCYFITNQESLFYQSESFTKVLNWLQRNSSKADLREINNKLVLSVKNIKTIYQAVEVLSAIQ